MSLNPKYRPDMNLPHVREAAVFVEEKLQLFKEVLANPVDVVTYSEFRRVMLPMLAEIGHGRDFDLERWLSMVSHPNTELSVVEDDDHSVERYRLSSVWQPTDISCKDDDLEGMSVYAANIGMMKTTDIVGARDMFLGLADERIDYTSAEATIRDSVLMIQRLNQIFADHDIPQLPDPTVLLAKYEQHRTGAAPEPVATLAAAVEDEEDEYDPL